MTRRFLAALFPLILLAATACSVGNGTATPTVVPLGQAATEHESTPAVNVLPTATPIPPPSPTPTRTPLPSISVPSLTPSATPATPLAEVIVNSLNVRQGPGVSYPILDNAAAGDRFKVIGVDPSGDWLQVIQENKNPGWISAQPLHTRLLTVGLDDLPFVEPPPLGQASAPVQQAAAGKPASNQATGLNGQLIFTTGSGGELYAVNVDGSGLRRLAGGVIDPVLSFDGRQVAFVRWDGAEIGALFTLDLVGGGERAIVGDIRQPKSPAWSPDGREIVISFQHGGLRDPEEECKEFDLDDGIRLPDNIAEITKSRISDDGIVICYILKEDLKWGLRRVNIATGQFEDLPADDYSYTPAWDPQQPWRVIYSGPKGLMQFDVTNNSKWPITTDLRDIAPVFSPDGRYVALTYKQHDHWEVYTINLETGARQRLTKPPILADPQYNSAAPAWSPDGTHLAFLTDRTGQWEIWVMSADGSNQRPLFSPALQAQLGLDYRGVYERMLNWTTLE